MKKTIESCYFHIDRKATSHCAICDIPICPECTREINIDQAPKVVCKDCFAKFQVSTATRVEQPKEPMNGKGVRFTFRLNVLLGLAIELLILGLIAREILRIAEGTNVSGWGDIGSIIIIIILAFIFWSIVFHAIKKFFRKAPKIVGLEKKREKIAEVSEEFKYCYKCGKKMDITEEVCPYCGIRQPEIAT